MSKPVIGRSKIVQDMLKMIERVAQAKTNVLIHGESGTGKELVARMLHDKGPFKGKPFVAVNCGAIPENLIESEMFGHRRGSFTGAVADKDGLFQVASTGTLFLDEIGELPIGMQVKLLRAIQDQTIRKVGGTENIKVDTRIIAATNRDLEEAIRQGRFREDLYYRLNVIQIHTPPLREREGDVLILAEHFLKQFAAKSGKEIRGFEPRAEACLENYSWPGNIRELENVIQRAVALVTGPKITAEVLPAQILDSAARRSSSKLVSGGETKKESQPQSAVSGSAITIQVPDFSRQKVDLERVLEEIERRFLEEALQAAGGIKKKAASLLGISFRSIRYRLEKLGLDSGKEEE